MLKKQINILFVCTGNLCRSPMAEYLLRRRANCPWVINSAGLSTADGLPASQTAIDAMAKIGIDLKPHHSRVVTKELIYEATIILAMTNAHVSEIKARFPKARDRVYLLGTFGKNMKDMDIRDPIGGAHEMYQRTLDEISDCLDGLIQYLKAFERN